MDRNITEVVFVLHGIRDLGRWSAGFEDAIDTLYADRRKQLAIVSSRYGYFGTGPFLFPKVRERYVRWFMDQYTETLARYPNVQAQHIKFFGHSNGTYLLAEALEKYSSMEIDRVVFAGSVVRRDFAWSSLTPAGLAGADRLHVADGGHPSHGVSRMARRRRFSDPAPSSARPARAAASRGWPARSGAA